MVCTKTMVVKENSFRKLDDPFENGKSKKYVFYVKVDEVPEGIPMATNPRDQKLTSSVAKKIEESLESNDGYFHLKNRGVVLSAGKVNYNNKKQEVIIEFDDTAYHGNIDGGHTYKIILEHKGQNIEQFVQFEVMTGVEDIIEQLAEARNTSVQVDEKSMAELENKFDPIKEAIEGLSFYKRIAFKQNQEYIDPVTLKKSKMIDAREIVSIISMFNISKYGKKDAPIAAYSSKAKMLNEYLESYTEYGKYVNIIPDIFDLYEQIEIEFAEAYNSIGGRYGRKRYSGYKDDKEVGYTKFECNPIKYKIPDGFMYPTVGAFRCLVKYNEASEKYEWKQNPIEVWEKCKADITGKIMNFAASIGDNPNSVGKDSNTWALAYMTVLIYASSED